MPQTPFLCDAHTAHLGGFREALFSPPPPPRARSSSGLADSGSVGIVGGGARSARTVCSGSASGGGGSSVVTPETPPFATTPAFRGDETEGSFSFPADVGGGARSPSGSDAPRPPRALRRDGSGAFRVSGVDAATATAALFLFCLAGGSSSSLSSVGSSSLSSARASASAPPFRRASLDLECFRQ